MSEYFSWMYSKVCTMPDDSYIGNYSTLFHYLHSRAFTYTLPMDANRESDGINLRYSFGWEAGIPEPIIASELDVYPCSVLEMMVALCQRMEHMMSEPDKGDRMGIWFWDMIKSLELDNMSDRHFDETYAECQVDRFLERMYQSNGHGGLVTLAHPPMDLTEAEIWDQAMWKLNEYYEEEEE